MDGEVLVLTAAEGIAAAEVERALAAGGREARALAPSAVEIRGEVRRAAAALAGRPVDANLVPEAGREKRLLLADMDSTVITIECIDEMAAAAGAGAEVAAITERAMRGELAFEAALEARIALVAGLPEAALETIWRERLRLSPGAETLARTMAARGALTALVSGGFTWFSERVARAAGFHRHRANVLVFEGGRLAGRVAPPVLGREAKRDLLLALCAETGIAPAAAVAVGDGANDLAMVEAAGLGVAYRAKPVLAARARARIDHGDLTAILALQGIAAADWVGAAA